MRNFLSSMLGALAALVLFLGGGFLLLLLFLWVAGQAGKKVPAVEPGSYLVMDLSVSITDAPPEPHLPLPGRLKTESIQIRTVLEALKAAAKDDRIAGLYLKGSFNPAGVGTGYAALKEVRAAIEQFRAAGKPVGAYLTYVTTRDYYLASAAGEIVLDPYGLIIMPGLAAEPIFFAGAFERFGIGVQVTRAGKYKSYAEPFTRKNLSPESREEMEKLIGDIWSDLLSDIAKSRGVSPADLQRVIDREGLIRPEEALAAKLADRSEYLDVVIDELKAKTGRTGAKENFKQVALDDYARMAKADGPAAHKGKAGKIAVLYAEGVIVDGEGEDGQVGGGDFSRELRRLRQDEEIKAIVLRVNSPGGSASASEAIQREMRLAGQNKPVVVSMGSYAASGGYWIAAYADRIFAESMTVTGSIGVVGIHFNVQKLANDLGVTFDRVKTGKLAGMLTISRPKTAEELAVFQRLVDWSYDQFLSKVAEGRKLDRAVVERIAQGRVWSGGEAVRLGLVDEIGGLESALTYAAAQAGLGSDYRVTEFPRQKTLWEMIGELAGDYVPEGARSGLLRQLADRFGAELKMLQSYDDPKGIYARLPMELGLN